MSSLTPPNSAVTPQSTTSANLVREIDRAFGPVVRDDSSYSELGGFFMTETEQSLCSMARSWVDDRVIPIAADLAKKHELPRELLTEAQTVGMMNLAIPEDLGGMGLKVRSSCLLIGELARGCAGITTSLMANDLALTPIVVGGSAEQKERFVAALIKRNGLAAFCLTEPDAGSDAANLSATLIDNGDHYILRGSKHWITNSTISDQLTVFARIQGSSRNEGIRCLVIPTQTAGVILGKAEDKLGQHASPTGSLTFDDVIVPKENVLLSAFGGDGFKMAMATLDKSRPMTAMIGVGIAQAALEAASRYATERKTFGREIGDHQMIQRYLASMACKVEAARLLTLSAAAHLDLGIRASKQSSIAKLFSSDIAVEVADEALQIFGGNGYSKEYPAAKLWTDARVLPIYEGTREIQQLVIARELLKGLRS